jgi:chaperonin GroES
MAGLPQGLGPPRGVEGARGRFRRYGFPLSAEERGDTTMAKVRPLHDRLLVKRIEEKETIKGGIIIPDTAKEKPQEGEVIAVGNGKILENGTKLALDVKAGDKILFGKYSGTEIKIDGQEYLILREDEVLAVIG